jgi:mono/diheme cytochrome c family protein
MRSFLPHPAIHHPLRIAGSILLLFACLVLLGSPWLATSARLQADEPPADPAASTAVTSSAATSSSKASEPIDFNRDIRPILANHCIACHGPDAQKRAGDLRLDLRDEAIAKAIAPNHPESSLLVARIESTDPSDRMPPDESAKPLSAEQIQRLKDWVAQGANYAQHWAFEPIKPADELLAKLPPHANPNENPIDRFLEHKLQSHGLSYAPEISKQQFLRRVSLDLTGLPPTWEQTRAFLEENSPDATQKLVDRLLESPRYAERWGKHWLDVARYADTLGGAAIGFTSFPFSYTFRDYVINAFDRDVPFDRFIVEQIAADQLGLPENDPSLAGLGFLTVGMQFRNPHDTIDDQIDVISRGLMGLTVSCARCHDHKFDAITTEDYYAMVACIAPSQAPESLPIIGPAPDPNATPAYSSELAALDEKHKEFAREQNEVMRGRLRMQVGLYLAEIAKGVGEQDVSTQFLSYRTDDLRPMVQNRWLKYLASLSPNDPVFGPWLLARSWESNPKPNSEPNKEPEPNKEEVFLGRIDELVAKMRKELEAAGSKPETIHALRSEPPVWNPLVVEALAAKRPKNLMELAQTYGEIFAEEHKRWSTAMLNAALEASTSGALLPDDHPEHLIINSPTHRQLRKHLYGPDSPLEVPESQASRLTNRTINDMISGKRGAIHQLNLAAPGAPARAMVVKEAASPDEVRVLLRGNPLTPGNIVKPRFLSALSKNGSVTFQDGTRRLELAKSVVSLDNPLTARVIVNWAWQHHFGLGLVRTPDDFGTRGEPPTHPELLDMLADSFRTQGWSLKELHRKIVTSRAYRQAAVENKAFREIDPENRMLWRMPRRRLDFESMRDSMLALSGELDTTRGGRPVDLEATPTNTRRSVFGFVNRDVVSPLMSTFDVANPNACTAKRPDTNVPQQTLFALNSAFIYERASKLSAKIASEPMTAVSVPSVATESNGVAPATTLELQLRPRFEAIVRHVFGRDPTQEESLAAETFLLAGQPADSNLANLDPTLRERRWTQLTHALLASNEFNFID